MKIIGTVGLPGSGKTTYVKKNFFTLPKTLILNPDSIRLALTGKTYHAPAESIVWANVKLSVEAAFVYGYENIVIDATNISIGNRSAWINNRWTTEWHIFPMSQDWIKICKERVCNDGKQYLLNTIDHMINNYQPVEDWEGIRIYVGNEMSSM